MERNDVIKALECCAAPVTRCDECPVEKAKKDDCVCGVYVAGEALKVISELTEENEAWQKLLITTEEKSSKAYYDLACEVENLRTENERLRIALNTDISIVRLTRGNGKTQYLREVARVKIDAVRADAVREMQERLKEAPIKVGLPLFGLQTKDEVEDYAHGLILQMRDAIDQIAKEMLEGEKSK